MIRVLLVDDQILFLDSLELFLRQDDGIEVSGTASNGNDALAIIKSSKPDIVLLDIKLPDRSGVEIARLVKFEYPEVKIMLLTTFEEEGDILSAFSLGCEGYVLKDIKPADLVRAVNMVFHGMIVMHPAAHAVVRKAIQKELGAALSGGSHCSLSALTVQEVNIARLVAVGLSNKEIAAQLAYTEGTVKNYLSKILQKTGCKDRTHLAIQILRQEGP
jgi:DNA-binding NarL/FixJ family response regulator